MTIQQLEYVLAVDRTKNFTRAAEQCNVTQATLSTMIKKLEDELGALLFDRKGTPVTTTEVGKALILEAQQIMIHEGKIKDIVQQNTGALSGTFRIGVLPTISSSLLPLILPTLTQQYPQLKLNIREQNYGDLITGLQQGKLDAAIVSTPHQGLREDKIFLYHETILVYGMEKMERKYIMPFELQDKKIWLVDEGHCFRDQCLNYSKLSPNQIIHNQIQFGAHSFDSLIELVDKLGGLCFIPELYYRMLPQEKQEKAKQFSLPIPVREISMIYHRPYAKHFAMQSISDVIRKELNKLISLSFTQKDLMILEI